MGTKLFTALYLSAIVSLAGCANVGPPAWTREFAEQTTTRTYTGRSRSQVIDAAENVLKLSDPKKVTFDYTDGGFVATRSYNVFIGIASISGTYTFDFTTTETTSGTLAKLKIYTTSAAQSAAVVPVGGLYAAVPTAIPSDGTHIFQWPASYQLFFDRLDHLSGGETDWMDCPTAREKISSGINSLEALCVGAKDLTP